MNKLIRHTTVTADSRIRRNKGGTLNIWNESSTIELTMTIREVRDLSKRLGIDIDSIIEDEVMGQLLHHFKDEGMLIDEEGERV